MESQGVATLPSRASFPPHFLKLVVGAFVPDLLGFEVGGKQGHAPRKKRSLQKP